MALCDQCHCLHDVGLNPPHAARTHGESSSNILNLTHTEYSMTEEMSPYRYHCDKLSTHENQRRSRHSYKMDNFAEVQCKWRPSVNKTYCESKSQSHIQQVDQDRLSTGTLPIVTALDPTSKTNYCAEILHLLPDFITKDHVSSLRRNTTSIKLFHWTCVILLFALLPCILAVPVRWEVGPYGECTTTCGRGTQSRSVICKNMADEKIDSHSYGSTSQLPEVMCPYPKPISSRSCSLISCAPVWTPGPWSECSRTCGRGIQKRQSFCTQRLATGTTERVPDVYCSRVRPSSKRKCAIIDCPPRYAVKKWSECSVTCGRGVQLRELTCVQIAAGQHVLQPISLGHCSHLTRPIVERYCRQGKCAGVASSSRRMAPRVPKIITARRTFIQRQRMSKVRFVVGMTAYVLPRTTVIIRCPVLRYRKALIYWKFNGNEIIPDDDDITMMPDSSLRIRSTDASNVGQYTCVAGESSAHFVLNITRPGRKMGLSHNQVYGEHRRRAIPSRPYEPDHISTEFEKRRRGAVRPSVISASVGGSIEHKAPPIQAFRRPAEITVTPAPILASENEWPEFENGGAGKTDKEILEDLIAIAERENQQKLDISPEHLRQVDGNFYDMTSFETTETEDDRTGVEILEPPRGLSFVPVPDRIDYEKPPLVKPDRVSENNQYDRFGVLDIRKFSEPRILIQPTEAPMQVAGDIVTYVGGDLVVAEPETVTLLCEASGFPTPYLEWLKDDMEIKTGDRYIILRSDHSLRILRPDLSDAGVYTCKATNELGSDSASTTMNVAKKPKIVSTSDVYFNLNSAFVDVTVGSTIKARLGSTVRISCRVEGFPEPHVVWNKDVSGLGDNSRTLYDNTLLIESTTKADQGTYSCEASNPAGTDYQASVLTLLEPPHLADDDSQFAELRNYELEQFPRLFMTSLGKSKYKVKKGTHVIIGCPVVSFPESEIHWTRNGIQLQDFSHSIHFEITLSGKALMISSFEENAIGNYTCCATNEGGNLTTSLLIKVIEYGYIFGNLTACTDKCGGSGTQHSTLVCAEEGKNPVDEWFCENLEKPNAPEYPCNRIDCPPRFNIGPWSSCSNTCGIGEKTRKVACVVRQSDNSIKEVHSSMCTNEQFYINSSVVNDLIDHVNATPVSRETCFLEACPQWKVGPWSACGHKCYGSGTGVRARRLYCLNANGTKVSRNECKQSSRPRRRDLCSTSRCEPVWIVSRWSSCSHTCGEDGIQTRILSCVFRGNKRQRAGSLCTKDSRPTVTSSCNREQCHNDPKPPASLSSGLCVDKSRYCSVAQSSGLCGFYRHLCCKTCG
uniref:ADAMTS-like protein 1 isoform X1 n=1 Tax=Styela clava TaxID=7725 RepID=UPI0019394FCE|nr:ADAMTS-like protein 1 isoform X1 [Styela clava]